MRYEGSVSVATSRDDELDVHGRHGPLQMFIDSGEVRVVSETAGEVRYVKPMSGEAA